MNGSTAVLVTTSHRGVFFGRLSDDEDMSASVVTLADCSCAIKFGTERGFLQLAATGPTKESRIGAFAPKVVLQGVTSITECTEAAVQAWEARR